MNSACRSTMISIVNHIISKQLILRTMRSTLQLFRATQTENNSLYLRSISLQFRASQNTIRFTWSRTKFLLSSQPVHNMTNPIQTSYGGNNIDCLGARNKCVTSKQAKPDGFYLNLQILFVDAVQHGEWP